MSYTTTCHVKENATITETLQYAMPGVLAIKTNDQSTCSTFGLKTQKVTPDQWAKYVSTVEGKTILEASNEFVVE